jgi:glycosyltransferase involved in cell wall biosynthesis
LPGKVLIITYYWPPSGGAGVQRWFKFAKYLPEYGWEPVVLTVDPDYAAYPVTDASLADEVHAGLEVHKTKATDFFAVYKKDKSKIPTAGFASNLDNSLKGKMMRFIRGNFFIPDPRKGWNKYAFKEACRLIEESGIKHIVTTSPPHSTQLIGLKLKRKYPNLQWIADLRDPWTDIYYYDLFYPTFISKFIDRRFEKKVLLKSDSLITVGNNLAKAFINLQKEIQDKIHVISNGYDEEDFREIKHTSQGRFTITYVGTLSEAYPIENVLKALSGIRKDYVLRFVGKVPSAIRTNIENTLGTGRTEFIPYSPHPEAVRLMIDSSILLLIIPVSKQSNVITTGKVFEYIASRRPVLYIGPGDGDAAVILKSCGQQGIFNGQSADELSAFINMQMESGEKLMDPQPQYSRKNLTATLVEILEGTTKK